MIGWSGVADRAARSELRLAWVFIGPALTVIGCVAAFPIIWTFWESLHRHDLRQPWLGRPFVGLANYQQAAADARFWGALVHTVAFTAVSVALELVLGLALALGLNNTRRLAGSLRALALLPWAVPTVVAALVWRFMFETPGGIVNGLLLQAGVAMPPTWFAEPVAAWVPIVLADVWKTTPFMALLLLAGLQNIDGSLYDAARLDGAGPLRQFKDITLPLLAPALLAAVVFRSLDALRMFDVAYVLTGGGPGTATEPLSLYAFTALFRNLRFGYGAAISTIMFLASAALALIWIRLLRVPTPERP